MIISTQSSIYQLSVENMNASESILLERIYRIWEKENSQQWSYSFDIIYVKQF